MGIALCFLPLILALAIFAAGFKIKLTHLLIAVLLGLAAVLPISFIQYFIPEIPGLVISPVVRALLKSIFLYGLVEEAIKTLSSYGCNEELTNKFQDLDKLVSNLDYDEAKELSKQILSKLID